jgi:hypothetical protein
MRGAHFNVQSVRSLAAAVALAALVALFARGCRHVTYWQGFKVLRIDLVVLDAETGSPVSGARVRLTPSGSLNSWVTTGPDGSASFVHQFNTSGTWTWLATSGHVIFHSRDIEVEAPGYIPLKTMLSDYLGSAQEIDMPDPPQFQVRIQRGELVPSAP